MGQKTNAGHPIHTARRSVPVSTGAERGIAAATVLRLAEEGHKLVLSYLRDHEATKGVATSA